MAPLDEAYCNFLSLVLEFIDNEEPARLIPLEAIVGGCGILE